LLPFFLAACGDASESPMVQTMTPTAVSVVVLETEPVALKRELPGRTRAFVIAEVRPLVTGIVKERLFTEGALVAAGDPLYQLVDSTYRAAVASAKAAVVRAEATLELARLDANRAEELRAGTRSHHGHLQPGRSRPQGCRGTVAERRIAAQLCAHSFTDCRSRR
jgi:membrane fusion protein (multidrug efflux system)